MSARTLLRSLLAIAVAAALVAVSATTATAAVKITRDGVGAVELGATFQQLRADGLVGRLREGCPLGGPGSRAAALRRPLRGSVDFTRTGAPRVRNITVTRGATARGVGVGDRARKIRRRFPGARFDHRTDETFGITLVRISRKAGGRLQLGVDVDTKRVTLIGVPFIAFCE